MRKKLKMLILPVCLLMIQVVPVKAEDFAGNESYYRELCSAPLDTQEQADQCARFKEYYASKTSDLDNQIADLTNRINDKQLEADGYADIINTQMEIIRQLENEIALNEAEILTMEAGIQELDTKIEEKQEDIQERDTLVKDRMRSEQKNIGTNMYIEFLMGATDVVDFIRILDGIQIITESDQDLIKALEEERAQLKFDQDEQKRLQDEAVVKKEENEVNKQKAQKLKEDTEPLKEKAEAILADLQGEKRNAQYNAESIRNNIANITTDVKIVEEGSGEEPGAGDIVVPPTSGGWMQPISGYVRDGTWYYYGSSVVHLGVDVAVPVNTSIYAPASGYIVYGANPDGTYSGWFGNAGGSALWGAGNTILLLCEVNGTTYAINFAHMAQENFSGFTGTSVVQGQKIGETGASGNVTGPHAHVEVVNLGSMGMAKAISVFRAYGDFAFGAGWGASALSYTCQNTGWATPCRERPEAIFGY